MPKKNHTKPAADDELDADALAFLKPLLRKATGFPTSRAEDKRIRRSVRALPSPLLNRVAERVYALSTLRFEAAREATTLGLAGPWRDLVSESSGAVSTLLFTINSELADRAIDDIRDLMAALVDALERYDENALARAASVYRRMPRAARDWWCASNHGREEWPDGDVPGLDYDFNIVEFVDGASELRSALNRRRKRRERSG